LAVVFVGLASCWIVFGSSAVAGSECGSASWYGLGGRTASGEEFAPGALTAAHRTLPLGTQVKVENLSNGQAVVVRINDRGPFTRGRMIDVTRAAAEKLGFIRTGVARVRMTVVGAAVDLRGSCDKAVTGNRQANVAAMVPPPRLRLDASFAARFGYAFLPADRPPGATRFFRELALRTPADFTHLASTQ
jgi:rare lipoprotein A